MTDFEQLAQDLDKELAISLAPQQLSDLQQEEQRNRRARIYDALRDVPWHSPLKRALDKLAEQDADELTLAHTSPAAQQKSALDIFAKAANATPCATQRAWCVCIKRKRR